MPKSTRQDGFASGRNPGSRFAPLATSTPLQPDVKAWSLVADSFDSALAVVGLTAGARASLTRTRAMVCCLARRPVASTAAVAPEGPLAPDNVVTLADRRGA
jgi:hypothetical protein